MFLFWWTGWVLQGLKVRITLIRLHATFCSNQIAMPYITGHTCVRWTIDCHGRACCETLCTVHVAAANIANYLNSFELWQHTPFHPQISFLPASIFRSISMSAVKICYVQNIVYFSLLSCFPSLPRGWLPKSLRSGPCLSGDSGSFFWKKKK